MFDEVDRLRERPELLRLLTRYSTSGSTQEDDWLDRPLQMEGISSQDLVHLHGELIAYGWIEQNTGVSAPGRPGVIACCYRLTTAGRRALKQAARGRWRDADEAAAA